MAHAGALGLEVFLVVRIGGEPDGDLFYDFEAVALEANDLFGVVGKQADFPDAEIVKHLSTHSVIAEVRAIAKFLVGLDGVESLLLKLVGVDFGGETDTAALLSEVKKDATFFGNVSEGGVKLASAIATAGAEYVAGEAFGVDPHAHWLVGIDFSPDEREVLGVVGADLIEVAIEVAKIGGHGNDLFARDEPFGASAVFNELGDGAGL